MVFSSYIFICLFLPIVVSIYYGLAKMKSDVWQKCFLVLSSLYFYGYYNIVYLLLILISIVVNYVVATLISRFDETNEKWKKTFLVLGIVFNVGLIGYFKYYDFFVENINHIFGTDIVQKNILLPLGISFFTFQQLSFLISVYKKEESIGSVLDYSVFVTFFPQLVAGPIVLYSEMIPQFQEKSRRYFNSENFVKGIYFFSIGLFKKAVIADSLAVFADNGFTLKNMGFAAGWATALSYTLQIYFDFSGYSDMAIGLGWMFNIELPFNFLSPYKSRSISEFWRKWHITLGRALSMYIYKPLGGNRKGLFFTCVNLMITFLISGLWHGAAWTFVAWGALHGIFVVIERIFSDRLEKIPNAIRTGITFMIVNALWVLFRAESFEAALAVWKGMISFGNIRISELAYITIDNTINFPASVDYIHVVGTLLILLILVFYTRNSVERMQVSVSKQKYALFVALTFTIAMIAVGRNSVFIYFNF